MIEIKKGLDLPLKGKPGSLVESASKPKHVALLGCDYQGLKPALQVTEDDKVVLGQPLFTDKKNSQVIFTAPASGRVVAINRGDRRSFLSLVIEVNDVGEKTFSAFSLAELSALKAQDVEAQLIDSGLWTAFRTRPFSKIPEPGTRPAALFVTAIDTNPLAPDPALAIAERPDEFLAGLTVLKPLTDGKVHLCQSPGAHFSNPEGVSVTEFSGGHPAGLVGTHVHFLEQVNQKRSIWHLGYQDIIAIGHLFLTGKILTERLISLAGPAVKNPRLLRTRIGACLSELLSGELEETENRVVSGSVLSGHQAWDKVDYLGRYHNQVSVLSEDHKRRFLGWLTPGRDVFSSMNLFISSLLSRRPLALTTSTHGSVRAMVPIGSFEKVMPLNVRITWLLRALLTLDTDLAQGLGCLELDEEDLALCSFVCSGKINYGYHLRQTLHKIEEEG